MIFTLDKQNAIVLYIILKIDKKKFSLRNLYNARPKKKKTVLVGEERFLTHNKIFVLQVLCIPKDLIRLYFFSVIADLFSFLVVIKLCENWEDLALCNIFDALHNKKWKGSRSFQIFVSICSLCFNSFIICIPVLLIH